MTTHIDLTRRCWSLQGWRPFYWQLRKTIETGGNCRPEFGPYPATVPGSAQTSLLTAGVLPDWNIGLNSLQCEWVEHRQWEFFTGISGDEIPEGQRVVLHAEGLDYSGWILVDTRIVGTFQGSLIRHRFDLSDYLADGEPHRLSVIFDLPPEEQGQIGRTSLSCHFKPRFSFSWDWCVRFVPVGIWDAIRLELGVASLCPMDVTTSLTSDLRTGTVNLKIRNSSGGPKRVHVVLSLPSGERSACWTRDVPHGSGALVLETQDPLLWWPNGLGNPVLYDLTVSTEADGTVVFQEKLGFKHVRWLACQGAPADARRLLCEINGRELFLQGVNWTPIRMDYPAVPDSDYVRLVELYRRMGCNLLRVWGGGYLEKEIFYRLCDRAGILVWQEFPLSSSGVDSDAPRARNAIARLARIARDYVRRRRRHVSLLLWCGGNELQSVPSASEEYSKPLDETHPALSVLKRVVESNNPGVRFLPTSPSGPVFFAAREAMGKGIHHHVHGPWERGETQVNQWRDYWRNDDALLRAETGMAGAANASVIQRHAGNEAVWPPAFENPWWRHGSAWWVQWDILSGKMSGEDLESYVALSQAMQADFLVTAAESCKTRFPSCAGFLVWMGHDAFPCPSNTSIVDFDFQPKAAYEALRTVFLKHGLQAPPGIPSP